MHNNLDVEQIENMFKYCVQPTDCHHELMDEIKLYFQENEKFMKRWNFSAGRRARKHLNNIFHLVRDRRAEISDVMYREGKEDGQ
tara:strand:- start:5682 stop:5936 length:255 start_codon:yes stop_codon:yes gene_type:complete